MVSILLVDDDELLRETLRDALADAGYEVHAAADGARALQHFQDQGAGLIIADIFMPEMDGLALLRAVRGIDPKVPIIAISGQTGHADYLDFATRFGARRTLQKPFKLKVLLDAVAEVLAAGD